MIKQQQNQQKQYNMQGAQRPQQSSSPAQQSTDQAQQLRAKRPDNRLLNTTSLSAQASAAQGTSQNNSAASSGQYGPQQKHQSSTEVVSSLFDLRDGKDQALFHFHIIRTFVQDNKNIFVMRVVSNVAPSQHWLVQHRFNEFRTLHEQLLAYFDEQQSRLAQEYSMQLSSAQQRSRGGSKQQSASSSSDKTMTDSSFVLPKFQAKLKSVLHGFFSLEKRTKFLNAYMNGLIAHNTTENLKLLLSCTLFTDFIDLFSHNSVKRKILKKLNEQLQQVALSNPITMMRKTQSTEDIASRYEEENKNGDVRHSSDSLKKLPPKNCNERIERLLTKLENAAKITTDFREAIRQLRSLDDFELISPNVAYNDDQIKRALIGNGLNKKGLLAHMANAKLSSPILKLLARMVDPQKSLGYNDFARVLKKMSKQQLMQCNFGQFFGTHSEERSVILIVDTYSRRQQPAANKPGIPQPPVNVFQEESQYRYFLKIYERWQNLRTRHIAEGRPKMLRDRSKNESFSSFSSTSNVRDGGIRKSRSGFLTAKSNNSIASSDQLACFLNASTHQRKQFDLTDGKEILKSVSSDDDSSVSSSTDEDLKDIKLDYVDSEQQKGTGVATMSDANTPESNRKMLNSLARGEHHYSKGGRKRQIKFTREIDLSLLNCLTDGFGQVMQQVRTRSKSSNNELQLSSIQGDKESQKVYSSARKRTEDNVFVKPNGEPEREPLSGDGDISNIQASDIQITSSSMHSSQQSIGSRQIGAPDDLDGRVLEWIHEYQLRKSRYQDQDDLLVNSMPQININELCTVTLRRSRQNLTMKTNSTQQHPQQESLNRLVAHLEEIFATSQTDLHGITFSVLQELSDHQKLVSLTISADTKGNLMSSDKKVQAGGVGGEQGTFLQPKMASNKLKVSSRQRKSLTFLLSYMQDGRDFFVSLFLVNEAFTSVNSDIAIILSQQISNLDIVQEEPIEEAEVTPPSARGSKTPNFASPIAKTTPTQKQQSKSKRYIGGARNPQMGYDQLALGRKEVKQSELLDAFTQLTTSEMQTEIVNPRKLSHNNSSSAGATTDKCSMPLPQRQGTSYKVPICTGDITLKVQVKHHKSFLKTFRQLLTKIVIENHLY